MWNPNEEATYLKRISFWLCALYDASWMPRKPHRWLHIRRPIILPRKQNKNQTRLRNVRCKANVDCGNLAKCLCTPKRVERHTHTHTHENTHILRFCGQWRKYDLDFVTLITHITCEKWKSSSQGGRRSQTDRKRSTEEVMGALGRRLGTTCVKFQIEKEKCRKREWESGRESESERP